MGPRRSLPETFALEVIEDEPKLTASTATCILKKLVTPALAAARVSHHVCVEIAAAIILVLLVLAPAVVVIALFVWAARKDGQADRAVQARLGIRRRTRLGR
jgi:hypothetical protein